jgi:hypothetical protein
MAFARNRGHRLITFEQARHEVENVDEHGGEK